MCGLMKSNDDRCWIGKWRKIIVKSIEMRDMRSLTASTVARRRRRYITSNSHRFAAISLAFLLMTSHSRSTGSSAERSYGNIDDDENAANLNDEGFVVDYVIDGDIMLGAILSIHEHHQVKENRLLLWASNWVSRLSADCPKCKQNTDYFDCSNNIKIFKTANCLDVISCFDYVGLELPSVLFPRRVAKFKF